MSEVRLQIEGVAFMKITYTEEKRFAVDQAEKLFYLSDGYPDSILKGFIKHCRVLY